MGRRSEIDWLYRGVARFFPEEWERFDPLHPRPSVTVTSSEHTHGSWSPQRPKFAPRLRQIGSRGKTP